MPFLARTSTLPDHGLLRTPEGRMITLRNRPLFVCDSPANTGSVHHRLLEQENFGRCLLSILGGGCRVSYRPKNNRNHPCVTTLAKFIEDRIIIVGDLQSIVFTSPSRVYVGGLILLTRPLPTLDRIVQSVIELNKSS
jgi:hypothetical protein